MRLSALAMVLAVTADLVLPVAAQIDLLLIGNSYTYYNNLDRMVQSLFEEGLTMVADEDIFVLRDAMSGRQMPQVAADVSIRDKIMGTPWDWVVLQDQSQIPGLWGTLSTLFDESLEAVIQVDDIIYESGAETVLMMTWGRQISDSRNPQIFPDFTTMQDRITEGYYQYRDAISTTERPVKIAPVGLAFQLIFDSLVEQGLDPTVDGTVFSELYHDGSHPSVKGSYLAACVLYATLTGNDPQELEWYPETFNGDIELRDYLQSVAQITVEGFEQHSQQESFSSFVELYVEIRFDSFPQEIGWSIINTDTNEVVISYSPGDFSWVLFHSKKIEEIVTLPRGSSYRFVITDSYGDGICCGYGPGNYRVHAEGNVFGTGAQFGREESIDFSF